MAFRTAFIFTVVLIGSLTLASAQTDRAHGPHAHRGNHHSLTDRLERVVELTPDQREQLELIEREQREQRHTSRADIKKRVNEVLTPAQREQVQAAHEQRKERRAEAAPMREELRAYHEQEVRPVLVQLRKDFDKLLTADERATLASLREQDAAAPKNRDKSRASTEDRAALRAIV